MGVCERQRRKMCCVALCLSNKEVGGTRSLFDCVLMYTYVLVPSNA